MDGSSPTLAPLGIGRLFELVADAVVVGDVMSGCVVAWNSAAEQLFGYDAREAIGMGLERLVPGHLRAAHLAGLARYAAGHGGQLTRTRELVEVPALHADGRQCWVEFRLAAMPTADEERRYVVAVFRDVTARRRAEAEAEQALAQMQAANASLRDFAAMAAHDIRSPIAGVAMAVDLLANRWDQMSETQRVEVLAGARRHTAFATRLLEDLLDVSIIESGQVAAQLEPGDLLALLRQAGEIAGVAVDIDVPDGLAVFADHAHVQRATANLIKNADKYGLPPIRLWAERRGQWVAVHVDDHGEGIPDEMRARMFDKFTRGHGTAHAQSGVGLGLAIVAGLVRANGGDVSYQPLAEAGSRFTCTWPAAGAPQPRAAETEGTG